MQIEDISKEERNRTHFIPLEFTIACLIASKDMAESIDAGEYFQHLSRWQVIICKECRFAVWPNEVQGHLRGKQHRIPAKEAQSIAEAIQEWPGITPFPSELNVPTYVEEPIPEIPLYVDGFQCQLDPVRCKFVGRGRESIRKHWKGEHGWSMRQQGGGSGRDKAHQVQRRFEKGAKSVHCQRFFPSRHGSSYFEVRQPEAASIEQAHASTSERAWERVWGRANDYWELMQEEVRKKIQKGAADEVSPWLKRTGWIEYFEDCDRDDLLQSIREPNTNEDDNKDENEDEDKEAVESAIWQAMGEVADISQTTVTQSGVMLRLEAIRTEMHQTRYQPLQPYQDASQINRRCRSWQQMLMFFVRTQRQHEWKSPPYRFSRRQYAAFKRLIEAAEEVVQNGDGEEESEDEGDNTSRGEVESQPDPPTRRPRQSGSLTKIQRACLTFCIELLNQKIHNKEYDMALICATAVLGIQPHGGGFRDPESYPPILSAIVKIAHFMVVQYAEELARPIDGDESFSPCGSPCDFEDSGYESNAQSDDGSTRSHQRRRRQSQHQRKYRSSFEWVQKMTDDFMVRGSGSPIQWILDLRTYGLKIHYNTTAIGHVNWKDKYTLEYKSLRFSMNQFRSMVHELVTATRQSLLEDVLFINNRDEIPDVPWHALHDDPANGEVGWNFIRDQRSRLPSNGRDWLYQRIYSQAALRERFVRADVAGGVEKERMRDWMRQVARFRGLLLILMHITGGQPARGTEMLSLRHRNTTQGGHRNLFIEDGTVVFVTKYHKGYQMSGDIKIIHRYLPREVGELVVWYLWLALPFIQRIEAMVWQKQTISDHMWPADADGRKWTTDRMKEELQQVSTAALGQPMHVAAYREIAIAISRQWVRGATAFQLDEADENDEWRKQNILSDVADDQATHSPHIAGMIYARDSMEMSGTTADKRKQFRAVSTDWHRFLGFESVHVRDEKTDLKRKRCQFESDADEEQIERRIRLRRMNASAELQRMMQKEVSFRSVQGKAMEAIQKGDSPIVAVMPTGSGKSVLFMLPAWVEPGGVSIVVVPLRALRKDMVHRCEQIGIQCAVWDGRNQPDSASIILVTPEKATSDEFGTFINRIRQTRRLDRIVIDECHVVLNDQLDFRKHLQELGKLAMAETQMVLLTATLPPTEEDRLCRRMYWFREEVRMIRASTVRRNIIYSVVDGGDTAAEKNDLLEQMVSEVLSDPQQPEGKVVVMCESKPKVEEIVKAGLFPCEMFHADLPEETKEETLDDFRAGNVRVIVATGAFGMGIDIADIRLTVHVDNPRNMMDYGQASGRAGRDGLASRAVIIRGGIDFEYELIAQYMDPAGRQCRRIEIDKYLDGDITRQQCQDGEEFCDECEQNRRVTQAPEIDVRVTQAPGSDVQITQAPGVEVRVTQAPEVQVPATQTPGTDIRSTQAPGVYVRGTQVSAADVRITQAPGADSRITQARGEDLRGTQAPGTRMSTTQVLRTEVVVTQAPQTGQATQAQHTPVQGSEAITNEAEVRREIQRQDQQRHIAEGRRINQVRAGGAMQQEIQQRLERWKGRCVVCHQAGLNSWHSITKCSNPDSRAADAERKRVQRTVQFAKNAGCYKCGVPRTICQRWTAGGRSRTGKEDCQFYGIIFGVVCGVKHRYPEIWEGYVERIRRRGVVIDRVEAMEQFWAQATKREGLEGNELLEAFMWSTGRMEREASTQGQG
jgi:superfamily II DNA helicase RecQ